jgi:hypothetical protein
VTWKIAWNAILLGTAILVLLLTIGREIGTPITEAEWLAEVIAPQLGVSESRIREVLVEALSEGQSRRIVIGGMPVFFLTALVVVRVILDCGATRQPKKPPVPPWPPGSKAG